MSPVHALGAWTAKYKVHPFPGASFLGAAQLSLCYLSPASWRPQGAVRPGEPFFLVRPIDGVGMAFRSPRLSAGPQWLGLSVGGLGETTAAPPHPGAGNQ